MDIIVISPVEFIFLQLRVAGYAGLVLVAMFVVGQVAVHGIRHQAVQERLRELELQLPRPGPIVVLAILGALVLMVLGMAYAWYGLIPLLLEYLTTDAQQAPFHRVASLGLCRLHRQPVGSLCHWFSSPAVDIDDLEVGYVHTSATRSLPSRYLVRRLCDGCLSLSSRPAFALPCFIAQILLFEAAMLVDRFTRG